MIENIKHTTAYKSLKLEKNVAHAYFFYSADKALNNNIALLFAKSLVCENKIGCNQCSQCTLFNSLSHPDIFILDKDSIKVEDANLVISKLTTKPIISNKKVFVILNAENMNETAQNKLLKSLEEPNEHTIFVLTSIKTDKILPTVLSRMSKFFVPKLTGQDKLLIKDELLEQNISINKYLNMDISLTEIINTEQNNEYQNTVNQVSSLIMSLSNSADIPIVVSRLNNVNKQMFFQIMQEMFLASIKHTQTKFDSSLLSHIANNYSEKAIIKCIALIERAYKMQMSNVNFGYIIDNLLFNMLKEKFLCK